MAKKKKPPLPFAAPSDSSSVKVMAGVSSSSVLSSAGNAVATLSPTSPAVSPVGSVSSIVSEGVLPLSPEEGSLSSPSSGPPSTSSLPLPALISGCVSVASVLVLSEDPNSVVVDSSISPQVDVPIITETSSDAIPSRICSTPSDSQQIQDTSGPSYAERFKSSLRNLRKISTPTFEEDGIPVVQAPESVLLQTAKMWKGHIVAQFHGLLPPPGKIYTDLNPAWGKHGNITIRVLSDTSCLIWVPCLSTREWVLQIGYWQAGNVAFSVFPWSPNGLVDLSELSTAPTWAILKNIPPQMYSLEGISVIASAIGEPLHTEKSRLDPFHFGNTKVKVEIDLDSSPPAIIKVRDSMGNSVRVEVSYPRLPPRCCNCGRFGHLLNRCPKPLMKKSFGKGGPKPFVARGTAVAVSKHSLAPIKEPKISKAMVDAVKALPSIPSLQGPSSTIHKVKRRTRSRSRSSGRGRSAPHVENQVVSKVEGSCVVEPDITVDHRVISDGTKDVVIPSLQPRVGQSRSEAPKSEEFPAAASSFVVKSSETIARSGFTLVGAGSHTKQKLFNGAANQISRQLQIPYQNAGKVTGTRFSKNSKVMSSSSPTQGLPLGLNSHSRQRFVKSWVGINKPLIGSILESHVSVDNAASVLNSAFPGWRWDSNYDSIDGGRILVVWDPSISVICLKKSPQLMLCGVFCPATNESFSVAFVYAFNTVIQRRLLWEELSFISQHSPASFRPWLLLGDFNQIVSADEHFSIIPHNLPLAGMAEFQDCLVSNDLFDLTSRGVFYTWSNGQPADPVLRKLDRALINEDWLNCFPDSFAIFDPPGDSDHSPCLVNTDASVERSKKSFKYFSFLSSHPKFKEIIALAWAQEVCVGSRLFTFGQRLKEVKVACKKLNREGFGNIQQKTKDSLLSLESIQSALLSNPSHSLFREEHVARQKWNFFAKAQEIFYRQKSRVRWMADGDANTSYFFRVAASNYARNCIKLLRESVGN
ncbi:unnamed protein product [Arabidopsis arenosa]|uniref:CCHC-type domain-containing protein n=1 Tax=Arabidopsis arenosa TaxID=38785 RepID=A0A8S1ZHG5_ARAAE|nr:unnamed protein product [Arabidopsis arenosa]